jgi:hypothetical protein
MLRAGANAGNFRLKRRTASFTGNEPGRPLFLISTREQRLLNLSPTIFVFSLYTDE